MDYAHYKMEISHNNQKTKRESQTHANRLERILIDVKYDSKSKHRLNEYYEEKKCFNTANGLSHMLIYTKFQSKTMLK